MNRTREGVTRRLVLASVAALGAIHASGAQRSCLESGDAIDELPSNYPGGLPRVVPDSFVLRYSEGGQYPVGEVLHYSVVAAYADVGSRILFLSASSGELRPGTADSPSGDCVVDATMFGGHGRVSTFAAASRQSVHREFSGTHTFTSPGLYEVLLKSPEAPAVLVGRVYIGPVP